MVEKKRPIILCFIGYYLPGFKAGGILRTVVNMVEQLSDTFDFWIVTRDRDLGDNAAYLDITSDSWQKHGGIMIYYCSQNKNGLNDVAEIVNNINYDVLYLNGFFDPFFTIAPLLALKLKLIKLKKPIVLAPRGEFSIGALAQKMFKKKVFIFVSKIFGLYNNVHWQASSDYEKLDIERVFSRANVSVASDLPSVISNNSQSITASVREQKEFKIIFLARISRMKNIDYAISVLSKVSGDVIFDIYGPIEDQDYWNKCLSLIDKLPANIKVKYCGTIHPHKVPSVLLEYDLFFLPSKGENFCHVIAESLSVGTPVLISDLTPWRDLVSYNLGWDFSLDSQNIFSEQIEVLIKCHQEGDYIIRYDIIEKYLAYMNRSNNIQANIELFLKHISPKI